MAKKPPERYSPGELERTRKNLGPISRQEAKKYANRLGGEIGIEKPDAEVEKKYNDLAALNRRKSDQFSSGRNKSRSARSRTKEQDKKSLIAPAPKPTFLERIRINYLLSRKEHKIITRARAFFSIFAFMFSLKDRMNPQFCCNSDEIFYRRLEDLVLSVRKLYKVNLRTGKYQCREDFFLDVITAIKDWDIENIQKQLARFRRVPRTILVDQTKPMIKSLYRPILRCIELDPRFHVEAALKRYFDLNVLAFKENPEVIRRLKNIYVTARDEALYVFSDIKFRLYPLLCRHVSDKAYEYEEFFVLQRNNILGFLGLTHADVILEPVKGIYSEIKTPKDEETEEKEPEEREEAPAEEEKEEVFDLLVRLFPGAGFDGLDEFPDLYAYFQPLFAFPRGIELIPPEDPLHQVVIFLRIIQELLYGFRSVEFGVFYDSQGNYLDCVPAIDRIAGQWGLFLDEVILNQYTGKLYEICREVERNPQFRITEYGLKSISDILYIKRSYLLPYLKFQAYPGSRPALAPHIPRLHTLIREFDEVLTSIAGEMKEKGEKAVLSGVKNPWEEFVFEIPNPVSKRLSALIQKGDEKAKVFSSAQGLNNANLICAVRSIVHLFHQFLNDPQCFFYLREDQPLYRVDDSEKKLPLYSVELKDPEFLFKRALETGVDEETGFADLTRVKGSIQKQIDLSQTRETSFSVLVLTVRTEPETPGVQQAADIISATVREFSDLPFRYRKNTFVLILPETGGKEAVMLCRRLKNAFDESGDALPGMAVIPFHEIWDAEEMVKLINKGRQVSLEKSEGSLFLYIHETREFKEIPQQKQT